MLLYTTGEELGTDPDNGEAFAGLLPLEVQREIREAEGAFVKGEVWEEMKTKAEQELAGG